MVSLARTATAQLYDFIPHDDTESVLTSICVRPQKSRLPVPLDGLIYDIRQLKHEAVDPLSLSRRKAL